jgi:hypothetical protein
MAVYSKTISGKRCKYLCVILLRENAKWNAFFGTHCGLPHHYTLHPTTYQTTSLHPAPNHLPDHIITPCTQPPTRSHHYTLHPTTCQTTSLRPAPNHLPDHIITPCTQQPTRPHHYTLHPTTYQTTSLNPAPRPHHYSLRPTTISLLKHEYHNLNFCYHEQILEVYCIISFLLYTINTTASLLEVHCKLNVNLSLWLWRWQWIFALFFSICNNQRLVPNYCSQLSARWLFHEQPRALPPDTD